MVLRQRANHWVAGVSMDQLCAEQVYAGSGLWFRLADMIMAHCARLLITPPESSLPRSHLQFINMWRITVCALRAFDYRKMSFAALML